MALGTSAFGGIRRERFRVQEWLRTGIVSGPRVKHAEEVRERGDRADRGTRRRGSTLLLQRNRGREAVDRLHGRDCKLVEEAASVRRDGFKIPTLRFGVERSEGERGLTRSGDAGEDDERVTGNVDVDIAEIVLASAANTDDALAL
jgi:hypothetical protein